MNFVHKVATININAMGVQAKKMLLKEFLIKNDIDVALLQEVQFEDFSFMPSHVAFVNISDTNKGTAILVRASLECSDVLMDPGGRVISVVVDGINFVNVYGHSGSEYRAERDELFTDTIAVHFNKTKAHSNLLAGDFNCVLDAKDCKGKMYNFSNGLKSAVELLDLRDVAITLKSAKREYTFYRGDSASRLDRIYVSKSFVGNVCRCTVMPVAFSDHHALVVDYKISAEQRAQIPGSGYWKINDCLLNEPLVQEGFRREYEEMQKRKKYTESFSEWWSYDVKRKVKQYYKRKAFEFNDANRRKKEIWSRKLSDLCEQQLRGENVGNDISVAKSKILEVEVDRLRGYACRFQPVSLLENEKVGLFHVAKVLKRKENPATWALKGENGMITGLGELKSMVSDHYEKLFSESTPCEARCESLDYVEKCFSEITKDNMLRPFTEDELRATIIAAKKKKAPGPDGITYEFYLVHFELLKQDLLRLFNGFLDNTMVPIENFADGVITLIPKNGRAKDLVNFRPISLLNTDYKIFTKLIANRISPNIGEVIEEGQTAVVPGKSCVDNLDIMRTLVIKAQQYKTMKFALLSVDLEKAFDVVNHNRLWEILEKFGLPHPIITVIKRLYADAASRVLVKGSLTKSIRIKRSVRQGCPLSMILFVLYIEPVIRQIYAEIRGILIDNRFIKIKAFADDITIIIRSDEEFDLVLKIIDSYSLSAGIKLNFKKSNYIRFNNCKLGPQQISEGNELKLLGLLVTTSWKEMVNNNFKKLIDNLKHTIHMFSTRRMNLIEKVIVLNNFVLAKLWYISQVVPPNNKHLAEIKMITGDFLWSHHKMFRVQRDQLYLDSSQGGLALIDPETQCQSLCVRNLLFQKEMKIDHPLLKINSSKNMTINSKKMFETAKLIGSMEYIVTNKQIYNYLISEKTIKVKIVEKYPDMQWEVIWENTAVNYLSSQARSVLFEIFNDAYPNRIKMYNHNFANVSNFLCEVCLNPDSNVHRIKSCIKSKVVWEWVTDVIKNKFKLKIKTVDEILYKRVNIKDCKAKSALWLVAEAVAYNMKNYKQSNLFCFKKHIREARWNNKKLFEKHFDKFLNIC